MSYYLHHTYIGAIVVVGFLCALDAVLRPVQTKPTSCNIVGPTMLHDVGRNFRRNNSVFKDENRQ